MADSSFWWKEIQPLLERERLTGVTEEYIFLLRGMRRQMLENKKDAVARAAMARIIGTCMFSLCRPPKAPLKADRVY